MKCWGKIRAKFGLLALLLVMGLVAQAQAGGGLFGGQIEAIAIDPINTTTVYTGTASGAFKSTNGGASWTAVNTGLTNQGVSSLAVDPVNPATVYAGTGSGGTFKTKDGGSTWQLIGVSPFLDIKLSKATYLDGETITASVFRLANPGPAPVAVELKVWLGTPIPGLAALPIFNVGADGSLVLPANLDLELGPFPIFPVSAELQRGTYEFSSRMLDPITGELLSEDLNSFTIQ